MEQMEMLQQRIAELERSLTDMQEKFLRQEKMASLGVLTAGIAHEVQNPLNFVINFSKLSEGLIKELSNIIDDCADKIEEDDADDILDIADDLKNNLQKIQEHGERAISIIRGILLQSRGKEGTFLPTDVPALVHEYIWLSYHAMRANDKSFNISIHEDYQEGMPQLMVIPQDFSRAVLNIMNNACHTVHERATKEGDVYVPKVDVKVTYNDETLSVIITDNGMGMSEETKKRLFENFFTTKPAGQGTGLGMGIVRDIIEGTHNGRLLFDSTEGEGTTFTLEIPAKAIR